MFVVKHTLNFGSVLLFAPYYYSKDLAGKVNSSLEITCSPLLGITPHVNTNSYGFACHRQEINCFTVDYARLITDCCKTLQ